jgi:DNA-binding MarR family transcriptional regulator
MSSDSTTSTLSRPQGCTNFKLRQLTRRVTQHYDQHMARVGLKITQYSLLAHVDRLGPLAPGELARRMEMDASTLTRNLQPLVAAGWVRVGEGVNARSRLLHLTEAGRDKRREAQRHWKLAQTEINDTLGLDRVIALHGLLDDALAAFHPEEHEHD